MKISKKRKKISIRRFNIHSVRVKIILSFCVPILFIIMLGSITYKKASSMVISQYKNAAAQTLNANANYLNFIFDSVEAKSTQIVSNANITKYYGGRFNSNSVEEYNAYNGAYQDLIATIGSDKFLYSITILSSQYDPMSTISNFETDDYKEFANQEEAIILEKSKEPLIWTGYHKFLDSMLEISESRYTVALTRYLYNKASKPIGYVILDIKTEKVQEIIKGNTFGKGSFSGFVTGDGRSLESSEEENGTGKDFIQQEFFQKSITDENVSNVKEVKYQNESYLFLYHKIGSTGAVIYSMIPKQLITQQADSIRQVTFAIVTLAVLIALWIGNYLSAGMSNTIREIGKKVHQVAKGDFTIRLESKKKDEFGLLANVIGDMILDMRELIQKTVHTTETVSSSIVLVKDIGKELIHSSESVVKSLEEIEHGAQQQGQDSENCLNQMGNLSERIELVYDSTIKIEKLADGTKEIVKNGMETVNELEEKVNDTNNITRIITDEILCLKEETKSIESIIQAINDVADQTNLLSLNASIEAARAGKVGMGFAVVAEEIRKLAEQSLAASNQVKKSIDVINARTYGMVEIANKVNIIVKSQEIALEDTVSSYNGISHHVDGLVEQLASILYEISQTEQVKGNTHMAIESITAVIEESIAVTEEISNTANYQVDLTNKLDLATQQLNSEADLLEQATKTFIL